MAEPGGGKFTCNVCGTECDRPVGGLDREADNCATCGSTVRLRGLVALLSQEIFGVPLTLPEFPPLKGIRGLGMSDLPHVAAGLAEKFDYTNTFYHEAPIFDITRPEERRQGHYDFIVSSEVMEHVPPPVERAFGTLCRMLKPDGFLLMTTPFSLEARTVEHFPSLHEYALASVGGKMVLVNRRMDGSVEVFENLEFHGGRGSTLEMRLFSESSLRAMLLQAGFSSVHFAAQNCPEFGVDHAGTWSLPIAARRGRFQPPAAELARQYREACRRAARAKRDLEAISAEYRRHIAFHSYSQAELERELDERIQYLRRVEQEFDERTQWALELESEKDRAIAEFRRVEKSEDEAWGQVTALQKELQSVRAELARLSDARWTRLGRKLSALD